MLETISSIGRSDGKRGRQYHWNGGKRWNEESPRRRSRCLARATVAFLGKVLFVRVGGNSRCLRFVERNARGSERNLAKYQSSCKSGLDMLIRTLRTGTADGYSATSSSVPSSML